jgi:hypothetical protein
MNLLTVFKEIIAVYTDDLYKIHNYSLQALIIKAGDSYSYHHA